MRPPLITVLAVLKFVSGLIWLILGLAFAVSPHPGSDDSFGLSFGVAFITLGGLALLCGYGLWTLRSYGRYLQIAFSILGLLVFPFQTVISILILFYVFQPGVRVLFSNTPIENLNPVDWEHLRKLQTTNATAIVVAVVVAIPVGIAIMGILAAIAIPNFLNAVDRGKQKRTLADLRSIGVAVESYGAAQSAYPTATTAADLQTAVQPRYIKAMPTMDGWGNAFQVESSNTHYTIYSRGKDGTGSDCEPLATVTYNDQICLVDGEFTRYPQGVKP